MELLLVIGIIAILAAIVIIAINPTKQLDDARTADRNLSIRELENAVSQYIIDGNTFAGLPTTMGSAVDVCQTAVTGTDCTNPPVSGYDLSALAPDYLVGIPVDPNETSETVTGYRIYRSGSFIKICSVIKDAGCGA